jgi:hypothetical protein
VRPGWGPSAQAWGRPRPFGRLHAAPRAKRARLRGCTSVALRPWTRNRASIALRGRPQTAHVHTSLARQPLPNLPPPLQNPPPDLPRPFLASCNPLPCAPNA